MPRITRKDWDNVAEFITNSLKDRKANKFRKIHERIWTEVDRQVQMQPLQRIDVSGKKIKGNWRSAMELGELSRASEILSADIRRMEFPQNRAWLEAHAELPAELDEETGESKIDRAVQIRINGAVRALMTQQHLDFGLKNRHDLSVKEALHHGSYVVTVEQTSMLEIHKGTDVKKISAPAWIPHSMWNCYPDGSQSISGSNFFYQGSMIIVSFMKWDVLQQQTGEGWFNLKNVEKQDKDVEIATYYGDIVIKRAGKDIHLPNSKAKSINGTLVFYQPSPLPYSGIIFSGYERLDVRDPYFVSPLTKQSPNQKIASILANNFVDLVELKVKPPLTYDGNDPEFAMNGGPDLSPGAKTPTKGSANFQIHDVGDLSSALAGMQFGIQQIQQGTSVDNIRSGVSSGTEQTATEVIKTAQGGEIRTIDFVDKDELHGLRPFLYMQHFLNKLNLENYSFYNPEMDAPDFERASKEDLPDNIHFEIVGSKGLLGEEKRQQSTMQWTSFIAGIMPEKLNWDELILEGYRDAGNKNPERFVNLEEQTVSREQVEQLVQQVEQQIQELEQELAGFQFQDEEHSLEIEQKELEKEQLQTTIIGLQTVLKINTTVQKAERIEKPVSSSP